MPLDHGCWFDQHQRVEDLRPHSVKPHPQEPVGGEEPKLTRVLPPQDGQEWRRGIRAAFRTLRMMSSNRSMLPPQDGHLMSQGDELKLQ